MRLGGELVVDCCALVHAKAMSSVGFAPLTLLAQMGELGLRFCTSTAVRGELECSSLRTTLDAWRQAGCLIEANATITERRAVLNQAHRHDPEPGRNDQALVALAARRRATLLTHDGPASLLARRNGVIVIDLVDIAALAVQHELVELERIDDAWGELKGLPWPWVGYPWDGSLAKTWANRPDLERVLATLSLMTKS